MRAGAVGINLTQANGVFLKEPCDNPALEGQAIGRVHRLGQKRSVEIIRLLMKDSIDSRMVEMLEKKHGELNASETNDRTDDDDDAMLMTRKAVKRILTITYADSDSDEEGDGNTDTCDGDKKPAAVEMKGVALDATSEAAVQEILVGSLYGDKAAIVAEESVAEEPDFLCGVVTTNTVMQEVRV
jgi:superfamily II DNA or RNA helicase